MKGFRAAIITLGVGVTAYSGYALAKPYLSRPAPRRDNDPPVIAPPDNGRNTGGDNSQSWSDIPWWKKIAILADLAENLSENQMVQELVKKGMSPNEARKKAREAKEKQNRKMQGIDTGRSINRLTGMAVSHLF